jgi:hypothetical protein
VSDRDQSTLKLEFGIKGQKLTGYLLNRDHPKGGPKARFLIGWGFHPDDPDRLALALLDHSTLPALRKPTPHGMRLECNGPLLSPNGPTPPFRTVWQIDHQGIAWLITAHPV